jgi:hypothetical protein
MHSGSSLASVNPEISSPYLQEPVNGVYPKSVTRVHRQPTHLAKIRFSVNIPSSATFFKWLLSFVLSYRYDWFRGHVAALV